MLNVVCLSHPITKASNPVCLPHPERKRDPQNRESVWGLGGVPDPGDEISMEKHQSKTQGKEVEGIKTIRVKEGALLKVIH